MLAEFSDLWNLRNNLNKVQGVSKKRYFLDFLSYFSSIGGILLFHMCSQSRDKNHVRAYVFRTVKILNGYFLNS